MIGTWLDWGIKEFCQLFPPYTFFWFDFNVRGLLAVLLVSLACGAVGALVVSNRMAFFSDALAHCAFVGVGFGLLIALAVGATEERRLMEWVTVVMVGFGILVGLGIAWVREKSGLSHDTVIGVFFAGAVGLGAILLKLVSGKTRYFSLENFLFGDLLTVTGSNLVMLFLLVVATAALLAAFYNDLVLASFNPSLALSRRVRVRLCNFTFIILLALIVNLCLRTVGALLINAMLIVPAATASNLARNLRQLFWGTIALCLAVGFAGEWVCWNLAVLSKGGVENEALGFPPGGVMVVLSVLLFFLSLPLGAYLEKRRTRRRQPA